MSTGIKGVFEPFRKYVSDQLKRRRQIVANFDRDLLSELPIAINTFLNTKFLAVSILTYNGLSSVSPK